MRPDKRGVTPVVAVLLLLTITVILTTTVYFVATSLTPALNPRPYVGMYRVGSNATQTEILVAEVTISNLELGNFLAVLEIDHVPDRASDLNPLRTGSAGNLTFSSMDDVLNGGDRFHVSTQAGHMYTLHLLWFDGANRVGSIDWTI